MLTAAQQHAAMWAIFAITYIGIALGGFPRLVLDRTGIALLGGIAMLVVQGLTIEQAAAHISYETMLLLFGLMIFSAQLRVAGFYVMTGRWLTRFTDRPYLFLAGLIVVSGFLSSLLANDIVCLAFTPLLCESLLSVRRDPVPYLLALAMSSNVGSAATIIGNPQNMHIGAVAGLPFGHFAMVMVPASLVGLAMCWCVIVLLYGKRMRSPAPPNGEAVRNGLAQPALKRPVQAIEDAHRHEGETLVPSSLPLQTYPPDHDRYLITKTLVLLAALVVFFLFARGESRSIGALAGAGVLLCSRRAKAAKLYQLVDWNLLLLFLGLFVVNGAMQEKQLTTGAFSAIAANGMDLKAPWTLAGITLVLSNLVSNVPAVLLLQQPLMEANSAKLWYLLALVSTWAGNLTLVGSIANLIVAESAAAYGVRVDLKTYCKAGIPLTVSTVLLGTAWILVAM